MDRGGPNVDKSPYFMTLPDYSAGTAAPLLFGVKYGVNWAASQVLSMNNQSNKDSGDFSVVPIVVFLTKKVRFFDFHPF